jgi:hypothetical protein
VYYPANLSHHHQLNYQSTQTETQIPRSNQLPKMATASEVAWDESSQELGVRFSRLRTKPIRAQGLAAKKPTTDPKWQLPANLQNLTRNAHIPVDANV